MKLLLLRDNFSSESEITPQYLVKKRGETILNESKDMLLNGVIQNIKSISENLDVLPINENAAKSNITRGERLALQSLSNNNDIIIKNADKGGGIVIMDTTYYIYVYINICIFSSDD